MIQINIINQQLEKYIKFVNKKYKEQKKELNNSLNNIEKKNKTLQEKKIFLENQLKEYEENELKNSNINSSIEKENLEQNIKNNQENKIIYSKKYISKNNNYFRKTQTNPLKCYINLVDDNKESQNELNQKEIPSNILQDSNNRNINLFKKYLFINI